MKVPEDGGDPISVSKRRLVSLSDQIQNIDSFKGKWGLIKSKLSNLQDQLVDLSDFPSSSSTPLAVDLLRSITQTLNDAVSLSQRCQRAGLMEGKLKTQSDLDAVLAKLNRHVSDCEVLIRSGVLQEGGVSTFSSKKEAVRVESRNLITRLQIGTTESKNSAIDSLLGLLQEDDKNLLIAVAQGAVPVLVRLLDSSCLETKEKTVAALSRVSTVESSKHVLIAEGLLLLNHLLRVLESGSGFTKEKACIALQALTFSKENARAIGSRGGISSLLEICQAGTPGSQAFAAGVLKNLTSFDEIKENIIEENAVFVLISLVSSGTALAQENSIGCLCNLVSSDSNLKLLIVKEGGIECLKNFMDSSPNPKGLEVALEFIRHLSTIHPIAESLVADGFISRLVAALNGGSSGVRIAAAKAVFELRFSLKTRKELGESGCVAPLSKMLDGKAVEEKEAGAMALSRLVLYAGNKKVFKKGEKGIGNAVMLLDPFIKNLDKKYPVLLLSELVHSKKCRKQMVAAGACVYLQKLVEMNVEGAKKLLESLGKAKMWGVFARP